MTTSQIKRKTYSVEEAAHLLGISRSLAYECVKTGQIPAVRFGSRIVIPTHAVDALIEVA